MTSAQIVELLQIIVEESRYKDGMEREALCLAAEYIEANTDRNEVLK